MEKKRSSRKSLSDPSPLISLRRTKHLVRLPPPSLQPSRAQPPLLWNDAELDLDPATMNQPPCPRRSSLAHPLGIRCLLVLDSPPMPFRTRGRANARSTIKNVKHKGLVSKNLTLPHPWCLLEDSLPLHHSPPFTTPAVVKRASSRPTPRNIPLYYTTFPLLFALHLLSLLSLCSALASLSTPFPRLPVPSL